MAEYTPFIIFGIVTGSIYGISAMGLVLTYKTTGVFNFAHGAVSAVAAYVFYSVRQQLGLPWPVAAVVAVFVLGPVLALFLQALSAALARVSTTYRIVATVGLLVSTLAAIPLIYGPEAKVFDRFLPQSAPLTVSGVQISWDNLFDVGLGAAAAVGIFFFFRRTRLGIEMRAVVDAPVLLDLTGIPPFRVRYIAWTIGTSFACLSGVLFAAAQQQLDVNVLSLLVVQAFGAAAIGRFTSVPLAFIGGLIIGLLQTLSTKIIGSTEMLQGLSISMPFIVLFLLLLTARRDRLVSIGVDTQRQPAPLFAVPARLKQAGVVAIAALALAVPSLVGSNLLVWSTAASQFVLFVSLSLLVRTSGQISLCHVGFAAVGAAAFGHFLADGMPWGIALVAAGAVAVPVGAIVAIPAIRLSGLYLALATFGFGIVLAQFFYTKTFFFGFSRLEVRRPEAFGLGDDTAYYYLLLVIALLAVGIAAAIERSRFGRILRALSESPVGLQTLGASINTARVLVFCLSAFLAAISGATFASLYRGVSVDNFSYVQSLVILAVLMISGRRTASSALIASLLVFVLPSYIGRPENQLLLQAGFGLAAIGAALLAVDRPRSMGGHAASGPAVGPGRGRRMPDPLVPRVRLETRRPRPVAPVRSIPGSAPTALAVSSHHAASSHRASPHLVEVERSPHESP